MALDDAQEAASALGETTVIRLRLRVTVVLPVGSLRSVLHASCMGAPYAHFTGGRIAASVSSRIFSEPSPACCMFIFVSFRVCCARWSPLFVSPDPPGPHAAASAVISTAHTTTRTRLIAASSS